MIQVKGVGGQIQFDGQYVTITRNGFLARNTVGKGEKRLHIAQITAIQWKPAGLVNGFIQFTVPGGNERRSAFGRQTLDASRDENSVVFRRSQQPEFEQLRAALDAAIARQHAPGGPAEAPRASAADRLRQLASLRDEGIITAADFEASKHKILGL